MFLYTCKCYCILQWYSSVEHPTWCLIIVHGSNPRCSGLCSPLLYCVACLSACKCNAHNCDTDKASFMCAQVQCTQLRRRQGVIRACSLQHVHDTVLVVSNPMASLHNPSMIDTVIVSKTTWTIAASSRALERLNFTDKSPRTSLTPYNTTLYFSNPQSASSK
jgi:hypothetical protein